MSVKNLIAKSLNIIFPVKCVCCRKFGEGILCEQCQNIINKEAARNCKKCGRLPYMCGCKEVENIDGIIFPYFYSSDKLTQAIYAVKKANLYYINEFFAKSMYNSLKICDKIKISDIDVMTNTPRMRDSIKLYGYNQTEVLAKLISKYAGINYTPVLEASKLYDREQKSLDKTQRVLNVKNKFTLVKKIKTDKELIKGKNVLIIDDVVTTGSTLSECARVMKNIGAENVYALCAASVLL